MEELLVSSWRRYTSLKKDGEATEKRDSILKVGLQAARSIASRPQSVEDVMKNDYLLTSNLSWYNPISRRHDVNCGPIVGILAAGPLSPSEVKEGKCGAGSEYAIISVADELSKRGYNVYVFCHIEPKKDWYYMLPCRNPQYLPIKRGDETPFCGNLGPGFVVSFSSLLSTPIEERYPLDYLIVQRLPGLKGYRFDNYSPNVYLWAHDFMSGKLEYTPKYVYVLSEAHRSHFKDTYGEDVFSRCVIGCNGTGVNLTSSLSEDRDHYRCIYASSYCRGLEDLIDMWPQIRSACPKATLDIYYGRETWGIMTQLETDALVKKIEALADMGVTEKGRVPPAVLNTEMSKSGFLLYPYKGLSETFSIVCVTAQQVGCIPIVKRRHALLETVYGKDKLLREGKFLARAIEYLNKDPNDPMLADLRKKHFEHASKYTWTHATNVWESIFKDNVEEAHVVEPDSSDEECVCGGDGMIVGSLGPM